MTSYSVGGTLLLTETNSRVSGDGDRQKDFSKNYIRKLESVSQIVFFLIRCLSIVLGFMSLTRTLYPNEISEFRLTLT